MNYLTHPNYNPAALLDTVRTMRNLGNDFALSIELEMSHAHISRVRNKRRSVGAEMMRRIRAVTGMTQEDMRRIMGVES